MAPSQLTLPEELFFSVDIETDGPIPGKYSMLSLGTCIVGNPQTYSSLEREFYVKLQPTQVEYDGEAYKVAASGGLDRFALMQNGTHPQRAMLAVRSWICAHCDGRPAITPVFVGLNAAFDWQFVNWYFHNYLGENPFGFKPLDICAYYMGKFKVKAWEQTGKSKLKLVTGVEAPHTHNALDDAREQAAIFQRLLEIEL